MLINYKQHFTSSAFHAHTPIPAKVWCSKHPPWISDQKQIEEQIKIQVMIISRSETMYVARGTIDFKLVFVTDGM